MQKQLRHYREVCLLCIFMACKVQLSDEEWGNIQFHDSEISSNLRPWKCILIMLLEECGFRSSGVCFCLVWLMFFALMQINGPFFFFYNGATEELTLLKCDSWSWWMCVVLNTCSCENIFLCRPLRRCVHTVIKMVVPHPQIHYLNLNQGLHTQSCSPQEMYWRQLYYNKP